MVFADRALDAGRPRRWSADQRAAHAVFRDSSDSVKINVEQIFKLLSPGTELKSL